MLMEEPRGCVKAKSQFMGTYMREYAWAETTAGELAFLHANNQIDLPGNGSNFGRLIMRNRTAYYSDGIDEGERKLLTLKQGDYKTEVVCLEKKYFDKNDEKYKDKLVGYVHAKDGEYGGKEYATLVMPCLPGTYDEAAKAAAEGEPIEARSDTKSWHAATPAEHEAARGGAQGPIRRFHDVYSKKRPWHRVVGYIETTDGEWLAVTKNMLAALLILLAAILAILVALGVGAWLNANRAQEVPVPNFSELADPDDSGFDLTAHVTLPEGRTSFDGTVCVPADEQKKISDPGYKGTPYSGKATIRVTLMVDGVEHLLVDTTEVDIQNGELPDVYIDFTKLDFELAPGVYYGTVTITYADGSVVQKPIRIVIYDSSKGSIGIGYSDVVNAYVDEGRVELRYAPQDATCDTAIQVLVINADGSETLIGQSGRVKSGEVVTSIDMESAARYGVATGAYQGIMRIWFDTEATEGVTTDLKTDIDIFVYVR